MKKNMKRVLLFLGMGSCVSTPGDQRSVNPENSALEAVKWSSVPAKAAETTKESAVTLQALVFQAPGSKDEVFFDSKPWLESDDEDFLSVNGDYSPQYKQVINNNGDHHAGRKLSELFNESSSFSSDSQASQKANEEAMRMGIGQKASTPKLEGKKSGKTSQRCLPSLVRSLSCGDRKKRMSPVHISVAG